MSPDFFRLFSFLFFKLFILKERENVAQGQRAGEKERIGSRLLAVSAEPDTGLELTNREIMT